MSLRHFRRLALLFAFTLCFTLPLASRSTVASASTSHFQHQGGLIGGGAFDGKPDEWSSPSFRPPALATQPVEVSTIRAIAELLIYHLFSPWGW